MHLELRDYTVFLDVAGLEAGKFDNNLLQSIRSARNFILVCTAGAMDRCINDHEQKDWIHKEIACALQSQCNIIPVFDTFVMPEPESLPETMRQITSYNGVRWIHDYQVRERGRGRRIIGYIVFKYLKKWWREGATKQPLLTTTHGRRNFKRHQSLKGTQD